MKKAHLVLLSLVVCFQPLSLDADYTTYSYWQTLKNSAQQSLSSIKDTLVHYKGYVATLLAALAATGLWYKYYPTATAKSVKPVVKQENVQVTEDIRKIKYAFVQQVEYGQLPEDILNIFDTIVKKYENIGEISDMSDGQLKELKSELKSENVINQLLSQLRDKKTIDIPRNFGIQDQAIPTYINALEQIRTLDIQNFLKSLQELSRNVIANTTIRLIFIDAIKQILLHDQTIEQLSKKIEENPGMRQTIINNLQLENVVKKAEDIYTKKIIPYPISSAEQQ
jgi:hypothetical protein